MLTDARFHRRGHAQGLMHSRKVVVHVKQGNHRDMVVDLLRKSIGQASEATHIHPHVEVLAFDVAGRNMRLIGAANPFDPFRAETLRGLYRFCPSTGSLP
jgi:hypothetical protein